MSATAPHAAEADNGKEPTVTNDERLLAMVDDLRAAEARRGIRAWLLAPTLELYHALMRGEAVPVELLNAEAVVRYGVRR